MVWPFEPLVFVTTTLSPASTSVFAAFNCLTFTASVSSLPSATFTTLLPPLSKPLLVKVTLVLPPSVALIVIPPSFIEVLPVVTEVKSTSSLVATV